MHFSQFIGVDISKDTLDAAIYPAKDKKMDFLHFDNTSKGLCKMLTWLKHRGITDEPRVRVLRHYMRVAATNPQYYGSCCDSCVVACYLLLVAVSGCQLPGSSVEMSSLKPGRRRKISSSQARVLIPAALQQLNRE